MRSSRRSSGARHSGDPRVVLGSSISCSACSPFIEPPGEPPGPPPRLPRGLRRSVQGAKWR